MWDLNPQSLTQTKPSRFISYSSVSYISFLGINDSLLLPHFCHFMPASRSGGSSFPPSATSLAIFPYMKPCSCYPKGCTISFSSVHPVGTKPPSQPLPCPVLDPGMYLRPNCSTGEHPFFSWRGESVSYVELSFCEDLSQCRHRAGTQELFVDF